MLPCYVFVMNMPVESSFPSLLEALVPGSRVLLTAPPGSGKTTRVPLFLMEHMEGNIIMLEPRRLATRSAARYMASQLGEEPGQRVGYRVRHESRVSRDTRVEIMTEGVLTRRLISDPELTGVSCVIFDEFHERSLQADTGLALCLEAQQALRPDLRILVMSATLDTENISTFLAPCPVIRSEGRTFPVDIRYSPCPNAGGIGTFEGRQALLTHSAATVRRALAEDSGSVLVFLPGQAEIRRVAEMLEALPADTTLHPLYGDLSPAEQDAAIAPSLPGYRKVVLATSIAETSLTIEGVRIVVDSGLARTARFSPATGMSALVTERVTQDAADQRAGRAGRIEPGICWRLWHEGDPLLPCRRPEMLEADLAPFLLDILAWGSLPQELPFLTPPPAAAVTQALQTLELLGAVHEKNGRPQLTPHGEKLARLPLHPRLAHMVLSAGEHTPLAAALAALTEERSSGTGCDIRPRLSELRRNVRMRRTAEQVFSLAAPRERFLLEDALRDEAYAGTLLSLAWPERLAQRRERGSFRMASGRGAILPPEDALADSPFLAIAAMDGGSSGTGRIHLAAPLERDDIDTLHADRLHREDSILWDERSECVQARRRLLLGALILEDSPLRGPDCPADAVLTAVLEGIARLGLACLPWTEELRQWQARVMLMRRMEMEENRDIESLTWPDVSDEALLTALKEDGAECWLAPWLDGVTRRSQFQNIALAQALHALLPYDLVRRLDREVPVRLSVPSGSEIRIDYLPEGGPVLAVKLQEMFGLEESPTVCGGRCRVLVHLLSPAGRPLQVTRDLAGFWRTGYAVVRAEMRGRYPKHPWPEDPLTATATKKTSKALARS